MKILDRIKNAYTAFRAKQYDDDDDVGVTLRELGFQTSFGSPWGKTKQLATYSKSLYVFRCVQKIAQKTASVDFNLFKIKNRTGDKEEVFVHDALDLIYKPNPFQTKQEFLEKYMINKLLTGQAFVLKVRNERGEVEELWNLRPDLMTIIKDKTLFIKGFEFNKEDGKVVFAPEDIIYHATPSPLDEWGGLSVLQAAQTRVDTEEFATKYQRYFFQNNARPDFVLASDDKIAQRQKDEIKEAWDKRHKGALNTGKGAFLEMGLKYQQVSISQREMDYIESLKMTRDDILTAFSVPKPIIAITEDVNYANAKTAMEVFLNETIQPEVAGIENKWNEDLIYPEYGDIFFIHYDEGFIPRNEKEEAEINSIYLDNGTKLINEVREEMGLEPVVGGWSLYKPVMEVAVGGLPQGGKNFSRAVKEANEKRRIFRGRSKAYKFLEIKEAIVKDMYKALEIDIKDELKNGYSKSIVPDDHKEKYAEVVNKQIDEKGKTFEPSIKDFAEQQKGRVIAALVDKYGDKSLDAKAVGGLFDKKKENAIFAEIALPFVTEFITSAGQEALQTVAPAETFDVNDRIQSYIKNRVRELAQEVNGTTIDKLSRVLAEGIAEGEGISELTSRVESVYSEYPTYRAETIARTEATAANNLGFVEGYQQGGVNGKEWIATGDHRTRTSHMQAEADGVIGINESFSNGLKYPGDPRGGPEETVNCRCVLAPAFKEE